MTQKKNLEGNYLNLKNSFAVLSNDELVSRSKKMGVKVDDNELEKFDVLKDLEMARANLNEKINNQAENQNKDTDSCPPLEEMRFIEWKSDSSEEEDFQIVSSRRSKKKRKNKNTQNNKKSKKMPILLMRHTLLKKGYPDLALGTTLGKRLLGQKILNDRDHLEL
jgi:hypothetical protein